MHTPRLRGWEFSGARKTHGVLQSVIILRVHPVLHAGGSAAEPAGADQLAGLLDRGLAGARLLHVPGHHRRRPQVRHGQGQGHAPMDGAAASGRCVSRIGWYYRATI